MDYEDKTVEELYALANDAENLAHGLFAKAVSLRAQARSKQQTQIDEGKS